METAFWVIEEGRANEKILLLLSRIPDACRRDAGRDGHDSLRDHGLL